MRRNARALILIGVLVLLAGLVLGFQKINIGNFERGGDTLLGLNLGLDLQGGTHLVYRALDAETKQPVTPEKDQMDALKRSIERRVNASGLGEPIIQILGGDRLLIQLPGVRDPDRAKSIIGETAQLVFKHRTLNVPRALDEISTADVVSISAGRLPSEDKASPAPAGSSGTEAPAEGAKPAGEVAPEGNQPQTQTAVGPATASEATAQGVQPQAKAKAETTSPQAGAAPQGGPQQQAEAPIVMLVEFTKEGAEKFALVADRLLRSFSESVLAAQGGSSIPPSRLDVSLEGGKEPLRYELTSLSILRIGQSTQFALGIPQAIGNVQISSVEAAQALLGQSPRLHFSEIQGKVDEDFQEGSLTGDDLARAFPSQHAQSGAPIVSIEFKPRGARIFGQLTQRIAGSSSDQIAIFLDNKELISPVVQTPITSGAAIIQGRDFTIERVRDVALLLESGRLPVPIELIQERSVDAILGADSLSKSLIAGLVGLALVLSFMILYYKAPGVVAAVALLIYTVLLLAIFKILPTTLTLSGVAAVILSIGMAVDANVLVFERMKEELRAGRTLTSAINIGFSRAWPAIRDSNVSTLISCAVLYWFANQLGVTIVQGFAVTLAIGVLVSMFSAITVSRTLLRIAATTALSRQLGLFVPYGGGELPQRRQQVATQVAERS